MGKSRIQFEWDARKEQANIRKHGKSFAEGATVLGDALAVTRFDADHSELEERWFTMGRSGSGELLIVVHTWEDVDPTTARVRIISTRTPTASERKWYEEETV